MLWSAFSGGAYQTRSPNLAADTAVNVYPETLPEGEVKRSVLYGTPGLKHFSTFDAGGTGGCRGAFSQDGRTWIVIGTLLYEVNLLNPNASVAIGTVPNDGDPVAFASNGRGGEQLAICGGGVLVILNLLTNVLSAPVVLPLTNPPVKVVFMDGYFLLLEKDMIRIWYSALENGLLWDALDFFARSQVSDHCVGLDTLRNRLWVFGSRTTELYYDSGDTDTPFVPYPGSLMQEGLVSPWAQTVFGEAMAWVAQDNEGKGRVVRATDYAPERISTPAIDGALASYPSLRDIELLVYEQEGHGFLVMTCPSAGEAEGQLGVSWCYDGREQLWHQRAGFDQARGVLTRWRARGCCSTGTVTLVGDYLTPDLATLDLDTFTDYGQPIKRVRRAPYLSNENQWLFLDQIELGCQPGVGLISGQGVDPVVQLRLSRDGGHTWGAGMIARLGKLGEYGAMAIWRRLGRVRADRLVIEVTQTDPVRCVWGPGLWIRATPGSGNV